jgi:hypothetical protein
MMNIGNLAWKGVKAVATPIGKGMANGAKATAKGAGKAAWNASKFGVKQFGKALKSNPLGTLGVTAATAVGVPVVAGGALIHKALFNNASAKDVRALEEQLAKQSKHLDYLHGQYIELSLER